MKETAGDYSCFVEVLLPLPVAGSFTYGVPADLTASVIAGARVVVQFGKRKVYSGLILEVHNMAPENYSPKSIISVLDDKPVVNNIQLQFWNWLSTYYMCNEGEVMNAALPSALKLASESIISLNPASSPDISTLNEREYLIYETLLNRKKIEVEEVSRILDLQKTLPLIKSMLEKGIILLDEELREKYKERTETFVELTPLYLADELHFKPLFDLLEKRAKKQLDVLMSFMVLSGYGSNEKKEVTKSVLLKHSGSSAAALEGLVKKDVFTLLEKPLNPLPSNTVSVDSINLTLAQQKAWSEIITSSESKDVVLLHGVTSSGKTEIYIKCMKDAIDRGKQVLFLLPEIALTTQIVTRLKKYFGNQVGVYHSRFNEKERVEVWNKLLLNEKEYNIILGARSAVFLPFTNLGLVIVDEEHDSSYKQNDPAPRYNGRDSALFLAHLHNAKTILGSATPSLESYYNCRLGKYTLVELNERYGSMELPEIEIVDLKKEHQKKTMSSHFSSVLIKHIESALSNKEQTIIFQNRRGFSLRLECDSCNWMPSCKNCDVTLVYHKKKDLLICHYCGYTRTIPSVCPECRGTILKMKGFGTEKVEEELAVIFPDSRIARMDLDTTRSRFAHQKLIDDLELQKIDILVGTQMVTKGLDFENVSTVSILNADNILTYPDFRSAERGFQLMAQVSGRSGRKYKRGKVVIQTFNPKNPIIHYVVKHDYHAMFEQQLVDRRRFKYPPFFRLIQLRIKHKDQKTLNNASSEIALQLKKIFGNRVLGPEYPIVQRIMNYYIKHIMIKIERTLSQTEMKQHIANCLHDFDKNSESRSVRVIVDVDPQ